MAATSKVATITQTPAKTEPYSFLEGDGEPSRRRVVSWTRSARNAL